ncbi:MAG TPA: hypothetical protein VMB47_19640 [Candidatus Aquilonibacter sp.]|nr:hypothetical protein [Candidatus Aquilonibacter sp.]
MNKVRYLLLAAVIGFCFTLGSPKIEARQVSVGVSIGPPPDCPYGYYDYAPYACAPYGYYGPEWFSGGVFIGAGPWFHGPADFHGHVNNHYDVKHGYKGPLPKRGAKPEESRRPGNQTNFKGNEMRDGRGHVVNGKH